MGGGDAQTGREESNGHANTQVGRLVSGVGHFVIPAHPQRIIPVLPFLPRINGSRCQIQS